MPADILQMVRRSYASPPAYKEESPGVPADHEKIGTLGDLLAVNYKVVGVRDQLRRNLLAVTGAGSERYPGIIGYDDDVLPAVDRAILAGHDILLVGQIGQAKTRLARSIAASLLSPIPVVRGGTTNDIPMDLPPDDLAALIGGGEVSDPLRFHVSPEAAEAITIQGLDTPIEWVDGPTRSRFVTATPDTTVKDLVGYVDAIKVAKRGIEMYRIESYSAGYLMQSKHGIFCIDELPVLDPRKQVALLSVLQEGSFTTGTYRVVFEPKLALFATANPVDYTHSGRIIEPLYDRLGSHVHTRYPDTVQDEAKIILQEALLPPCVITDHTMNLLAGAVRRARQDDRIDQEKGVSVRSGIHGMEVLVAEAARVRPAEQPCPRPSDMDCIRQAVKFRLSEMEDTVSNRSDTIQDIMAESAKELYVQLCPAEVDAGAIAAEFAGKRFEVSQRHAWSGGPDSYESQLAEFPALAKLVDTLLSGQPAGDGPRAAAVEVALECLRRRTPPVLERRDDAYGPS